MCNVFGSEESARKFPSVSFSDQFYYRKLSHVDIFSAKHIKIYLIWTQPIYSWTHMYGSHSEWVIIFSVLSLPHRTSYLIH